ncbi:MAG TPA: YdeI/OmpD-associated family protein [Pyrinomonadaceae bacterium]|nr:YdeI/OmpD-associated family protein [Pyrinomonadaceae bacterium]
MGVAKQIINVRLEKHEKLDATGITIPFDVEEVFGAKRVPVKATVNDAEYRGTIVRMGGKYMLGIPKVFREAARIDAGDDIVVTLEQDVEERTVTIPSDLAELLKKDAALRSAWDSLSFTIRKENARDLENAKRPETRARRLEKTLAMLQGRTKR